MSEHFLQRLVPLAERLRASNASMLKVRGLASRELAQPDRENNSGFGS
jgi:hypothetical protein